MAERARQLAEQFERANAEFIAAMEQLSGAEWQLHCPGEDRTVAALAHHVAGAYLFEMRAFQAIARGDARQAVTWDEIHAINERHAAAYAGADRQETLRRLRVDGAEAARRVRALTDEQLQREGHYIADGPSRSVEQWIERVLLGHIAGHLASIQAAVDASRRSR